MSISVCRGGAASRYCHRHPASSHHAHAARRRGAGPDPGPAAAGRVRAGPSVGGAERKRLLAAFNGGFELATLVGGYEQEGHVISPLRPGYASLVIDRSGHARIGVWGHGVPAPGEAVYSVRQILSPLVMNGQPAPAASDWPFITSGDRFCLTL